MSPLASIVAWTPNTDNTAVLLIMAGMGVFVAIVTVWLLITERQNPSLATADGASKRLRKLLERKPQQVDLRNDEALTLLMIAAARRRRDCLEVLLEYGAALEEEDRMGRTALGWAIAVGAGEIAERLLQAGANPNHDDRAGQNMLHLAVERGDPRLLRLLLDHGADPNQPGRRGWTALHATAARGHSWLIPILLAAGADPQQQSDAGDTALDLAADRPCREALSG